jgi:thiamine biosynthesis lipoprotein
VSPDALADFDHVLRVCDRLHDESAGSFTIHSPITGGVDTAGYVKGFAMRRAVRSLRQHGVANFVMCVGGDTYCGGQPDALRPWRIAIADPFRDRSVAAVVEASNLAVATSGTAERGEHIWNGSGPARPGFVSFTVLGPDIAEADAYATIGFAMGEAGVAWVASQRGYRSLAIRSDGSTAGDAALVSAA